MNTTSAVTERPRAKQKKLREKSLTPSRQPQVITSASTFSDQAGDFALFQGGCETLLASLPEKPLFDLIVTSPPYNIGKPYEQVVELEKYRETQRTVITELVKRLKPTGSLCWQVGNFVVSSSGNRGGIYPLDFLFHPLFEEQKLVLRNRIIWRFGHGLHCRYRFSGRYETILWYTKAGEYHFDLDKVRVAPKYPSKRHYKGPNAGKLSSNPKGKNPEDVWEDIPWDEEWDGIWQIPNVKSNHVEKQAHPCQFPVGLVERLVLALTPENGLVFDPYSGVASSGVAAAIHGRRFWGCEIVREYVEIGLQRLQETLNGNPKYRPHDRPIYDHTKSPLSKIPDWASD
jgi:adenine-specific DNA-methyltransferase